MLQKSKDLLLSQGYGKRRLNPLTQVFKGDQNETKLIRDFELIMSITSMPQAEKGQKLDMLSTGVDY